MSLVDVFVFLVCLAMAQNLRLSNICLIGFEITPKTIQKHIQTTLNITYTTLKNIKNHTTQKHISNHSVFILFATKTASL